MNLNALIQPETVEILKTWGYFVMFGLMVLEGPLVTIAAAFLASMGIFDIYIVAILWWLGDLIGDLLFFCIGRYGFRIFEKKTHAKDKKTEETFFTRLDSMLHKNLLITLLTIKITPYAPPIGISYIWRSKVSFFRYIRASFISCLPIPLLAIFLWFNIGYINSLLQQHPIEKVLIYWGVSIAWIILIFLVLWFWRKKSQKIIGEEIRLSPERKKNKL